MGDGVTLPVEAIGPVALYSNTGTSITLTDVLLVPKMIVNLVSISRLAERGVNTHFGSESAILTHEHTGTVLDTAPKINCLYLLTACMPKSPVPVSPDQELVLTAAAAPVSVELWHRRLAHMSIRNVKLVAKVSTNMLIDSTQSTDPHAVCAACAMGKMQARPYAPSLTVWTKPGQVVFLDLMFLPVPDLHGHVLILALIDRFASYSEAVLLKTKSAEAVHEAMVRVLSVWYRRHGWPAALHIDNGTEFVNSTLVNWCAARGIIFEYGAPYAHQSNGTTERFILNLANKTRAVLHDACLPDSAWGEVLVAVNYLSNLAVPTGSKVTSHQLFYGTPPVMDHLRVIGCLAYVLTPPGPDRKKLDPRARPAALVGYNHHCKGYRFLLPSKTGPPQVIVRRDAVFDERRPGWPLISNSTAQSRALLLGSWDMAREAAQHLLQTPPPGALATGPPHPAQPAPASRASRARRADHATGCD